MSAATDAAGGYAPPRKRSVTLKGHRTSVTLEDPFWQAVRAAAGRRGVSVNALVAEIDAARPMEVGLASALRVFALREAQRTSASTLARPGKVSSSQ